ncbi:hypothetical protein BVG81_003190 [Haliangium sp. UPWRP_2]|nr:hypothetical protein BVG81_003190 [Haliangium sp. UPWRP_2]
MLIDTDENATIDCSAQLIGWRYQLTYWDLSVLLRAGELTMWNSKLSPLKQIVEIFSGEVANLDLCIQAARQLIIVIEQEAIVKSAAQTTYRIILDHLCSRPGGVAKVDKMIEELPGLIRQRFRLATLTFGRSR